MSFIDVIQQQSMRHSKAYVLRILMIYNTLTFGVKKALFLCMDKCGGERIEVPASPRQGRKMRFFFWPPYFVSDDNFLPHHWSERQIEPCL